MWSFLTPPFSPVAGHGIRSGEISCLSSVFWFPFLSFFVSHLVFHPDFVFFWRLEPGRGLGVLAPFVLSFLDHLPFSPFSAVAVGQVLPPPVGFFLPLNWIGDSSFLACSAPDQALADGGVNL